MRVGKWLRAVSVVASLASCEGTTTGAAPPATTTASAVVSKPPKPVSRVTLTLENRSGIAAPWGVVELRSPGAKESRFFQGDATGRVELDVPPGTYDVEITAPNGYAKRRGVSLRSPMTVDLEEDCERTAGRAGGDVQPGELVWFQRVGDGAYYGALVGADSAFAACLPVGAYVLEAHDDELAAPFVFDSGTDVTFEAFEPSAIDAPAPSIVRPALSASIESVLAAGVRVVGVGEANHGAREFLRIRMRESLALARKRGFHAIALEAGPAEVFALDDYIHGRVRDVKLPVSKLGFWMWDTKDMLEVLSELRAYNRRAPASEKISLVGIDVQRSETAARYLLGSGLSFTDKQRAALEAAAAAKAIGDIGPKAAAGFVEDLRPLTTSTGGTSPLPLRTTLALEQVLWRLSMHAAPPRAARAQRELGMAALVSTVLRHEDSARIVIWAHNTHVSTDPSSEHRPMGAHLRALLGADYASVGVLMIRGTFRAWDAETKVGVIEHTIEAPPASSLEAALAPHVEKGDAFMRLADVPELKDWLRVPHRSLANGGQMPHDDQWPLVRHAAGFDIIGVVAKVTPTTPTPTGVRRANASMP